jgi:hypothetical protein
MQPASVLAERRAVVLALEPKAPQAMPSQDAPAQANAGAALLRESLDLLGQALRQGLRHLPPALRARVAEQATRLDDAGYPHAGRLLRETYAGQRGTAGPDAPCGLALLLGELMH